jgi:lipopolysaccharide transport system ATP-binding protein
MSSNEIAVQVNNVSKCYAMYKKPIDRLKQMAHSKFLQPLRKSHVAYYDEFWALKDINFEVPRGQTLGIMGQNGSGKSTLLQIIAGTLSPTTGTASVNGRVAALLELGSGFHPDYSGIENVYLNASLLGFTREQTDQKLDDILSFADIGVHINQPVKTYSSGMMVRLAFAVQAAIDSEVLIIDEALAVGDARFQLKCFRRLQEMKDKGTTILFVSHATEMVRSFCDTGIFLDKGEMKFIGEADVTTIKYLAHLFPNQENAKANEDPKRDKATDDNNALFFNDISEKSPNTFGIGGAQLNWLEMKGFEQANIFSGGEEMTVRCHFSWDKEFVHDLLKTKQLFNNITLGISICDSQGRYLFGFNGFDQKLVLDCLSCDESVAKFQFALPYLNQGTYFMTVAVALGTLENHEQLIWYDALIELKCVQNKKNIFGTFAVNYQMDYEATEKRCA